MPAARLDSLAERLFAPLASHARVALAISGGSDSMSLLALAAGWQKQHSTPFKLTALTVDHGLRPESAAEARQVAAWCKAMGVDHHILEWQGPKPAAGLQAAARDARYGLMTTWCRSVGAGVLCTAHTADDQAETVLMRLARTASVDSIAGIPAFANRGDVTIFRPLLDLSRKELRAHLQAVGQAWIEDPSNSDIRFERVRVRQRLAELSAHGMPSKAFCEIASAARLAGNALGSAASRWISDRAEVSEWGYATIGWDAFRNLAQEVQLRVLAQLVFQLGGGLHASPLELERLRTSILGGSSRRTLAGAIIVSARSRILIGREPGRLADHPVMLPQDGRLLWDGRFDVAGPPGAKVTAARFAGPFERLTGIPAFVQQALPVLQEEGGAPFLAHLAPKNHASARLSLRKCPVTVDLR